MKQEVGEDFSYAIFLALTTQDDTDLHRLLQIQLQL